MKTRLENMGLEPTGLGPAELAAILRTADVTVLECCFSTPRIIMHRW